MGKASGIHFGHDVRRVELHGPVGEREIGRYDFIRASGNEGINAKLVSPSPPSRLALQG